MDVLDYMVDQMAKDILLNLQGDTLKEQILFAINELLKRKDFILILFNSNHFDLFRDKGAKYIPQSKLYLDHDTPFLYFNPLLSYLIPLTAEIIITDDQNISAEEIYEQMGACICLLAKWFSQ